jgi:DNA-binding phage protein
MDYWQFIESQREVIQLGDLEEHHVYPDFDRQSDETIWLSPENHAIASVLQSREWGRQCIHGRQVALLPPELLEEGGEWSNYSILEWMRTDPEAHKVAAKAAGIKGQEVYKSLSNHQDLVKSGGSRGGLTSNRTWREKDPEAYFEAKRKASKMGNAAKFRCKETGYISTAAGVVARQRGLKIDTSKSNRERI